MADGAPSREDIYQAIRNADKAGDSAAVQRLGEYLGQMDSSPAEAQAPPPAPQNNSLLRWPLMAGQALVKGGVNLLGLPGNLEDATGIGRTLVHPANPASGPVGILGTALQAGNDLMGGRGLPLPPTGRDITTRVTDPLSLTNSPSLTPTGPWERYGAAGVEAIPAIAASVATGGAALPMIASGEAGAFAGQAAHDLAPDSTWAPVAAGLAAGLGVGGVTSTVRNALNARTVTKAADASAVALSGAASRLDEARDAAFTGRKALADHTAEVRAASQRDFDVTKGTLAQGLEAQHALHDSTIGKVAQGLGKSTTLQEAGEALQREARNWINTALPKKLEAVWTPVNDVVPKDSAVNLANFSRALHEINTSAGKLEPLAALLKPGAPKALAKALGAVNDLGELTLEGPSAQAQALHSWGDVQKLRSTLGDAMSNPRVVADVGEKNLSRLYATLTADMKTTAKGLGAGDLFDSANAESRRLYQIGEGPMSRLVAGGRASAEDPSPETAAKGLLASAKSGASDLATLKGEIPNGLSELAAAHLRLDPKGFAKLSPEAVGVLFSHPEDAEAVSGALAGKAAAQEAHASGLALAAKVKAGNLEAIRKAQAEGNWRHAGEVRSSAKELKSARDAHAAALAAKAALPGNSLLDHSGTSISGLLMGEEIGHALDPLLLHGLGVGRPAGAVIGALAPKMLRGGVNLLRPRGPADIAPPALGAAAAANALYGPSR